MATPHDDKATLAPADVAAELLDDWRYLLGALHARFETGHFATGLRLVAAIGAAAEEADHHPDVDLRYPHVTIRLVSHDVGGVTQRDVRLARKASEAAAGLGATARPEDLRVLEWGLDSRDHAEVAPFWAAVLGLAHTEGENDMLDPDGRTPSVWFQEAPGAAGTAATTTDVDQRWHPDVWVPLEMAERRVREAVAAGGTLVSDGGAPAFWVLADAHGNRVCLCTPAGRD